MRERRRLDRKLVELGLTESRERAQAPIMAGRVVVDGRIATKAGALVKPGAEIHVKGEAFPYVSRGGLKLEHALSTFKIEVEGKVCVDVGASTGGFTHCLLEHGARRVYAIDVGHGQLDWRLRQDPRVVNMERINVRYLDPATLPELADLVVVDVSFISLELVLPVLVKLLKEDSHIIALIKPQFEVGKGEVEKGGVVRSRAKHRRAVEKVLHCAEGLGLAPYGLAQSPEVKPRSNVEYFVHLCRPTPGLQR